MGAWRSRVGERAGMPECRCISESASAHSLRTGPPLSPPPQYVAIEHMNVLSSKGPWLRRQHWAAQACVVACFLGGGAALMVVGKFA